VNISKILKKYWNLILSFLTTLFLISLLSENLEKVLVIFFLLIVWNILGYLLRDFVKASFVLLLAILPFNITYQLPINIGRIELFDPFVNGIIVNYLIPTLHFLDFGVFLLLTTLLIKGEIKFKWKGKTFLKIFSLFATYLVIQSIFKHSFLALFNSLRLLLYIFTFYKFSKISKEIIKKKDYSYILILSLLLVVFQGIIAYIQFDRGVSLGLFFLGESDVVSGMRGSSFVALNNQLFLRGYGTFPHPNVFGGWLIFNILLGWWLFDVMNKKRDYAVALMVISSLVLVLTFSRVSFLVCIVIWLFFIIKLFITSKESKNFAFIGLLSERVLNLFKGGDTGWSDRVGLMKASIEIMKKKWLTGVGLGRFIDSMGDSVPRSSNGVLLLQPVHNIFLLIVSEIGLIGFSLYSALLYFFFRERKWSLSLVVGLVSLFIIGMFDHYLFSLPQGMVLFFLIILI
jgi:hypothetical protein